MSVLSAEHVSRLDAAGSFAVTLPVTDPRTSAVQVGRVWRHFREGEGFVFAGLIEDVEKTPESSLHLAGPTLLDELAREVVFYEGPEMFATSSVESPATGADDASNGGSVAWGTPTNVTASDDSRATANLGSAFTRDHSVQIVKNGAPTGAERALPGDWPAADAYATYGGPGDLWGLAWAPAEINASDFGIAVACIQSKAGTFSHWLVASDFGFAIPSAATVTGIQARIERSASSPNARVDHMEITVFYIQP